MGPAMRRPTAAAVITFLAVAGSALFVLLQLQPGLLFADTTPAGGDMGAHVWGPAYLRDHVLPKGRLTGWTPDWYAGFPAYHFYFPLPNLVIVALSFVLPYGVAFKLVTVSGVVTLPVATWWLGRSMRLPFPIPPLFSVAAVVFVFDRFHTIWGGNAAATLAGEFAFSIALSIAAVYLGVVYRALETGNGRALAAVLIGATALCHLLPAAFAVLGTVVMLLGRRPDRVRWRMVVTLGAVGFALAAFWFVPFLVRHMQGYSNDMGWERTEQYLENLLPWMRTDDQASHGATRHLKVTMPLAVFAVGIAVAKARRATLVLAALAVACGAVFVAIPHSAIWNARFLPFWYLTTYLLAATTIGEGAIAGGESLIRSLRPPAVPTGERTGDNDADGAPNGEIGDLGPDTFAPRPIPNVTAYAAPIVTLLVVVFVLGGPLGIFSTGRLDLPGPLAIPLPKYSTSDTNFVPAWARWNYSGYERKDDYPEYREVVQTMARVGRDNGCGRAMWEYESELNRYGTPMALMLLPYWTDGCIGSMEGLFFESSATVPYHFLNQSELSRAPSRAMRELPYRDLNVSEGVKHLQLMGVRYYMAISPEAQAQADAHPDLRLVATTNSYRVTYGTEVKDRSWRVYEVAGAPIVAPLEFRPVVVERGVSDKEGWLDASVAWYQESTRWSVPVAAEGPADWPRVATTDAAASTRQRAGARATVSDVVVKDDRISFRVDRTGVPVVVRMSYFPNWKARGAEGPWRVTPNFMVVIPTSKEVTLRYGWTAIDSLGWLLTLAGAAVALAMKRSGTLALRPPRPRRVVAEPAWVDPFAREPGVDPPVEAPGAPDDATLPR